MSSGSIDSDELIDRLRVWARARAEVALQTYSSTRFEEDDPSYPFEREPGQRRSRSPASHEVTNTPVGIRISVESVGALFKELGNAPGGSGREGVPIASPRGRDLRIRKRGYRGPRVSVDDEGNFFSVESVKSYAGYHTLRDAVYRVFGVG